MVMNSLSNLRGNEISLCMSIKLLAMSTNRLNIGIFDRNTMGPLPWDYELYIVDIFRDSENATDLTVNPKIPCTRKKE